MNGGARGRRMRAATDMVGVPATGGDATAYGGAAARGLGESVVFQQKCRACAHEHRSRDQLATKCYRCYDASHEKSRHHTAGTAQ